MIRFRFRAVVALGCLLSMTMGIALAEQLAIDYRQGKLGVTAQGVTVKDFLRSFGTRTGIEVKADEAVWFKAGLSTLDVKFGRRPLSKALDGILRGFPYTLTTQPDGRVTQVVLQSPVQRLKAVAALTEQARPVAPAVPAAPAQPVAPVAPAAPAQPVAPVAPAAARLAPQADEQASLNPELAAAAERLKLSKQRGAPDAGPVPPRGHPMGPAAAEESEGGPSFLKGKVPDAGTSGLPGDPAVVLAQTKTGQPFLTVGEYNALLKAMQVRGRLQSAPSNEQIERAITLKVAADLARQQGYAKSLTGSMTEIDRTVALADAIARVETASIGKISEKEAESAYKTRPSDFSDLASAPPGMKSFLVKQRLAMERWTERIEAHRRSLGISRGR